MTACSCWPEMDGRGRLSRQNLTWGGFPGSFVAPPAAPIFVDGHIHVIESYGLDGAVGAVESHPRPAPAGLGQFIDAGNGDYAGRGPLCGGGRTRHGLCRLDAGAARPRGPAL